MEITLTSTGFDEAAAKLSILDNVLHERMRRALFRIGGLWKRTAVQYAPVSPSTTMLRKLLKGLGETSVRARKGGRMDIQITKFYAERIHLLLSKSNVKTRPMPGGLMRSITVRNTDTQVEVFVPSNSPAGSYAVKIHEEKGSAWKHRGPGTQAKGAQADDKFITRAATDKQNDFAAIVSSEIDKILEGLK